MKLNLYIVAMEACDIDGKWVWISENFTNKTKADKKYKHNINAVNMWKRDYRNPQKPKKVVIEVTI